MRICGISSPQPGKFVVVSVGLELIIGFALAMFIKESFLGSGIITTLILVPMMLSPVVVGLFWKLMYNPTFGYNQLSNRDE